MNTCEWLDRVKKEFQLVSDYKLAKLLGISPNRISNYRNSNIQMDDDLAMKVESLLGLPGGTVLLDMHALRTKCSPAAEVFRKISQKISTATMAVTLALISVLGLVDSQSAYAETSFSCQTEYTLCAYMCEQAIIQGNVSYSTCVYK